MMTKPEYTHHQQWIGLLASRPNDDRSCFLPEVDGYTGAARAISMCACTSRQLVPQRNWLHEGDKEIVYHSDAMHHKSGLMSARCVPSPKPWLPRIHGMNSSIDSDLFQRLQPIHMETIIMQMRSRIMASKVDSIEFGRALWRRWSYRL